MQINKLTVAQIDKNLAPGRYGDGGGLWLQVSRWKTKSWIYQFTSPATGKVRQLGLGPYSERDVSLKMARDHAAKARALIREGIDPIDRRRNEKAKRKLAQASLTTFSQAAERYVTSHAPTWRNAKHRAQWGATLQRYAFPIFGNVPVGEVDTNLVMKSLEAIWRDKPETAKRLRGRIERILDWAAVRGLRTTENPARWRGHLDHLLAAPSRLRAVTHHPALPYQELPSFFAALNTREGAAARALEITILSGLRTNEVISATWDEIDLDKSTWIIPAQRMKAAREHRIPLTGITVEKLNGLLREPGNPYVFVGGRPRKPLSNMAMLKLAHQLRPGITVHGFRSSFRDWAAETTAFPNHVVEMALAHTVGNKVEAAYRRGDLFEKRKHLMADWAGFCCSMLPRNNVVSFSEVAA
jgi:integrase